MKKVDQWIPEYWNSSPMFSDHRLANQNKQWETWPNCNELNGLWPHKNKTLSDYLIKFVPQNELGDDAIYYEEHIFSSGEIPTRDQNWHDFFNAQVWLRFPKTKAVLNAQHVSEIKKQDQKSKVNNRNRKRDALTLFDESGVIFVSSDDQIIEALHSHEWKKLFWEDRSKWWRSISVYIFGHGLYEKALSPYIGMTGNAMPLLVESQFFDLTRTEQIIQLDQKISNGIMNENILELPSNLSPLPLLGIPEWWQENKDQKFYENKNYFRPRKK